MKRRHIAYGAIVIVLLTGAVLATGLWGLSAYYGPEAPTPHYAMPANAAQAQRDDLDYLRKFLTRDWSYTPATRAQASALIDRTLAGHLPVPAAAFELVVSRVVAIADNGHTNVWAGPRAGRMNRLPLRFFPFPDGLYIVRALPQAKAILSEKVVAFDGRPFTQVRQVMNQYTGGAEETRDMRLPFALESPQLLHAAGVAKFDDRVILTVEDASGARRDVTVAALPPTKHDSKTWPIDDFQPAPLAGEDKDWQPALRGEADNMLFFADPSHEFVMRSLPAQHALYIRFNSNRSTPAESIGKFTDAVEAEALKTKPAKVIVDMRRNGGGDYTTTAGFMRGFPSELPGATFYVLEGPFTFSAGMTSAAFLKQAGGARTVLVGSRPGDRIRFHSEGSDFCLPFSKICMSARTAIHDYATESCRPIDECFALDLFYPVAIKTFEPEIHAPLTFAALRQGHDPALDAIFATK